MKWVWGLGLLVSVLVSGTCRTRSTSRVSASPKERKSLYYTAKLLAIQHEIHRLDSLIQRTEEERDRLQLQRIRSHLVVEREAWQQRSPGQVSLPQDTIVVTIRVGASGIHAFSTLPGETTRSPRYIIAGIVQNRWNDMKPGGRYRLVLLPLLPQNAVRHASLYVCIVAYESVLNP